MRSYQQNNDEAKENSLNEDAAGYLRIKNEEEKLREAVYMNDMEKFRLFTKMLRRNAIFNRAIVTHKK